MRTDRQSVRLYIQWLMLACVITLPALAQKTTAVTDTAISGKTLDNLVITGQYKPQTLRSSVYQVKVIPQEVIKMRGATDIMGILNTEIGLRFSTDNTLGESDTKIMGIGGAGVKVLMDGIPLVDRDATRQSLGQIDINAIERIEIVEGPMSVIYGTDALAGVINIITKKHKKDELRITARVQEETVADNYSPFANDGVHNEHLGINYGRKGWQFGGSVSRNAFGGLSGGEIFPVKKWKPKDQWMGAASAGYRFKQFSVSYRLDYLNEDLFTGSAVHENKSLYQHYITNRYTHQLQSNWNISGNFSITNALSYQDYKRNTETFTKDFALNTEIKNSTGDGFWDITAFKSFFYRGTALWNISSTLSLQPGIEVKTDKTSGQRINGNPAIEDYSFFVSVEIKPVKGINIRPGVRFIKNSIYDAPPVIPSINAMFNVSSHMDWRVSYARGYRAPILRELYFSFHDANHDINGNPNLKAEQSNSYNTSLTWYSTADARTKITTGISAFYNAFKDKIETAQLPGSSSYSYINISDSKNMGATWQGSATWKKLVASAGISYIGYYNNYKDDKQTGNHSAFAFATEVNTNLLYTLAKLKASVGLFYKYTGKVPAFQNDGAQISIGKTDAFHMADFTATKMINRIIELQGGVKNIFDVTTINNSATSSGSVHSTSGPVTKAYGRSYFIGINFQWSKNN